MKALTRDRRDMMKAQNMSHHQGPFLAVHGVRGGGVCARAICARVEAI